jgi:hypothetical protein
MNKPDRSIWFRFGGSSLPLKTIEQVQLRLRKRGLEEDELRRLQLELLRLQVEAAPQPQEDPTTEPWLDNSAKVAERLRLFIEAHPETVADGWGCSKYARAIGAGKTAVYETELYQRILANREAAKQQRQRDVEHGEVSETRRRGGRRVNVR